MHGAPQTIRDVAITFAGGGNRAFYQLGLLHHWGERLRPRIAAIAASGAGASVATLWLSGRETQTRRFWNARRQGVRRNFQWTRMLRGRAPMAHQAIYRDTLLCAYAEQGLEEIRAAPFPVLVITTAPPRVLPRTIGAAVGLAASTLEKRVRGDQMETVLGKRLGFSTQVADARRCTSAEELADLVMASSSPSSITPLGTIGGPALLDAGLIDDAPTEAAEKVIGVRRNLVLLTRPYPSSSLGQRGSRLYVAPTHDVPAQGWDYTQPERVAETIGMGEREALVHDPALRHFLVR